MVATTKVQTTPINCQLHDMLASETSVVINTCSDSNVYTDEAFIVCMSSLISVDTGLQLTVRPFRSEPG